MIESAIPVRFDFVAQGGRSKPLRVGVETNDGSAYDAYLKGSGFPELDVEAIANEAIASCLAIDLGLPITRPFLVRLGPSWINTVPDLTARAALSKSCEIAFACEAAGAQWVVWSSDQAWNPVRQKAALPILAFDAFINNFDRRDERPNCLVNGDEFKIIDHELAFRLRMMIPRPKPWTQGGLSSLAQPGRHIFVPKLKGIKLDLAPIRQAWSGLSDIRISSYKSAMPTCWAAAAPFVDEALDHVRKVRDSIDECIVELGRVLK